MSFDHVMAIVCTWIITLLYIYFCVWGLNLRLNNINYFCWYYSSSIIITSLYWTSETPLRLSITTSEYLICDTFAQDNKGYMSRLLMMDLTFIFHFSFYFILFCFSFIFLFLEQLGLGLSVTLSHQSQIDGIVTRLITRLGRRK